jgi:glycine/D-amino acid oxidase-like deaminating enzyme
MENKIEVDHLIIGQGLAGTLLAHALLKNKKQILVIDENREITSSKIAAGMFNPISGKRMVKNRLMDKMLVVAKQTYIEIEKLIDTKILFEQHIYTVFGSIKEQNDLSLKLDDANFSQHINTNPTAQQHIKQPFGAFEIKGSGWVNTKLLLEKFKNKLLSNNQFITQKFEHDLLKFENEKWHYKTIIADTIFFCEGKYAIENPFFSTLNFQLCKGDILTIECIGLSKKHIIKKGIYLVHLYDSIYKVGSTYEWNDLSEVATETGLEMMRKKLDELLDIPYTIISHQAAVRPTTRTREPILLKHETHKNMFMLNGLGTKGVLHGPWWVNQLINILKKTNP